MRREQDVQRIFALLDEIASSQLERARRDLEDVLLLKRALAALRDIASSNKCPRGSGDLNKFQVIQGGKHRDDFGAN